jgi:hypothetical protein
MPRVPYFNIDAVNKYAEEQRLERQKIENERQLELELLRRIARATERIANKLERRRTT